MRSRGTLRTNVRRMPMKEREAVIELLRGVIEAKEEITFAVVFGGFLNREFFRDLDLGVHLKDLQGDLLDALVYADSLSVELTKLIGIPVDVVVLNYAPMWLRLRALRGRVIVDRDPILRLALKLAAVDNSYPSLSSYPRSN